MTAYEHKRIIWFQIYLSQQSNIQFFFISYFPNSKENKKIQERKTKIIKRTSMSLIQISKNSLIYEFEQKLKNIDQIASLAIAEKQSKIADKYANIQSTAKILKSLIIQFTKKSIKIEEELRQAACIDDLQSQTHYHTHRLEMCMKLSSDLQTLVAHKKGSIQKYEFQSQKLKQDLILTKTENIKKILKIEMLENLHAGKSHKQNHEKKTQTFKQKMNQNRIFMQTASTQTTFPIDILQKQKQELTAILWSKISKKLTISKYLLQNYQNLKQKLVMQQKKSNVYGLNGSLFFKIQENNKLSNILGPSIGRKKKFDQKLIIYDVLKQKHSKETKAQNKEQSEIRVDLQQFMNFTPIQLLGLIELRGGVSSLHKNGESFISEIKRVNEIYKTNENKLTKKHEKQGKNYLRYVSHV